MENFNLKIAGQVARVHPNFESTREYCRPYLTADAPDFELPVTRADMDQIQRDRIVEARQEGIRVRYYADPYLERAVLQKKFAEHLFFHDTLMVHGSAVAVDGTAYLFTADCGIGKSTHTRFWRQMFGSRAVMVNDDKPFLTVTAEGVLASGSPWSGKHGLDTNITVPLGGICILERGKENRIWPIGPEEARRMLGKQSYRPENAALESHWQALVDALGEKVPLWRMACNLDPQAAVVAYEAMRF